MGTYAVQHSAPLAVLREVGPRDGEGVGGKRREESQAHLNRTRHVTMTHFGTGSKNFLERGWKSENKFGVAALVPSPRIRA